MTDSNNPVEGTASLTAAEADSAISALLGSGSEGGEAETAVEAEVPSHEDEDTTEVQPETDTAEEEHAEEDAEPETAEVPSFGDDTEVEVNGERIKVKDLKSGYLRHSDYTRKTQELAQQRQQAESQVRGQYLEQLRLIEQQVVDHFPQEPNWQMLAEDNPAQYAVVQAEWNKRLADLHGIKQLRAQHEQNALAEREHALAQAQDKAYADLVDMHPEFGRTADGKMSTVALDLVDFFTQEVGLPKQLLQSVDDARIFAIIYDAYRFRKGAEHKSKAIQAVANKPPLTKPGVTQSKATAAQADLKNQMARLKRTGRPEDAESLIRRLL